MTDNEIIKALECCKFHDCESCDFEKLPLCECIPKVATHTLDLINRLQAKVDFMTEQRDIYMQEATDFSKEVDRLLKEMEGEQ